MKLHAVVVLLFWCFTSLAAPQNDLESRNPPANSGWWFRDIERNGKAVFLNTDNYKVFRNVKDYGAKGDGVTDDTQAINRAFSEGNRCGHKCDSATTTPALVYFPPGTYVVSSPILPYYYTHMIGDIVDRPVIKASADFEGMAVIDADPYDHEGKNWHTNQNNFFRQIRNLIIDLTGLPPNAGTGIHWQVAQATSLQNLEFRMHVGGADNAQQGLFMDNGSGGFMTDITFIGGRYGAFMGSQQFTSRNLLFKQCQTAIFMNWNWLWAFHNLQIEDCEVGINMTSNAAVGSVLIQDSKISNTQIGVVSAFEPQSGYTNGSLIIDNVDMSANVGVSVQNVATNNAVVAGGQKIRSYLQGRAFNGAGNVDVESANIAINRPQALLNDKNMYVTRSKPQYENVPKEKFLSVKKHGAKGDGVTDDSDAIQAIFNKAKSDEVVYFDHGAYLVTKTIDVPKNIRILGEIWPLIMASGDSAFQDQNNPQPMFRVGKPGDKGNVEISDLMIETHGPQPGAILMEWNVEGNKPGDAGLWDVHFRVGGSAGTKLQSDICAKTPKQKTNPDPKCIGAWMLMHITPTGSGYFENCWWWISDHELDLADHNQINIYNGRGVLIESKKGNWLWGTASEHNVLYNYQFTNAKNVFMSAIQTETAYFQGNPDATVPFEVNAKYYDPDFRQFCGVDDKRCARTWGLRAMNSSDIVVFGGGLYSFFDNYDQKCVPANSCQDHMISLESSSIDFYGLSTKASVNMVTVDGKGVVLDKGNRNVFCATLAQFTSKRE